MANKWTWMSLLAILGALLGVALSVKPWQKYRQETAEASSARSEMRAVEAERSELTRQQAKMDSPLGREELARQRGYKKTNEQPWEPR